MSSFSRLVRAAMLGSALIAATLLSACAGLTPLYGTDALGSAPIDISYAAPANRLEQIVYKDLALRLGRATATGPQLQVTVSEGARALTSTAVLTAQAPEQVTLTARIRLVSPEGKVLLVATRAQSADYSAGPQVLANEQAARTAEESAAHLLADTVRLTVLGALAK